MSQFFFVNFLLTWMQANFHFDIAILFCSQFLAHCVFIEQEHRNQVCYIFFSIVLLLAPAECCWCLLCVLGLFFSFGEILEKYQSIVMFFFATVQVIYSVVLTQSSFTRKYFRELVESVRTKRKYNVISWWCIKEFSG